MGYKKPTEVSKEYLKNLMPPKKKYTYLVAQHKFIINKTAEIIKKYKLNIEKEIYKANLNGNIAQGLIYLNHQSALSDAGMMFGWTNSHDNSVKFQCAVGAYVKVCSNLMISGEISYISNKLRTVLVNIEKKIEYQIKNAYNTFDCLEQDKISLERKSMSFQEQCGIAGLLYIDKGIVNSQQINVIKNEMINPSYDYEINEETAWAFYNHVTHALKSSHPKNWLKKSKQFHNFMTTKYLGKSPISKRDIDNFVDYDML